MVNIKSCLCLELGSCSILAAIYTTALSVIFIGIGVDELVLVNRRAAGQDIVTLTALYGLLVALSVLYAVSSAALLMAVTRKRRAYFLPWLILTPLWTTLSVVVLVVLPLELSHAVKLGDSPVRLTGTVIILLLNTTAMVCVSLLLHIFRRMPRKELKSQGVVKTLSAGFRDASDRIRNSFRVKQKPTSVTYNKTDTAKSDRCQVTIPHMDTTVVLQPANLEVIRSEKSRVKARKAAALSRQEEEAETNSPVEVTVKMTASLANSQQLTTNDMPGLDNPGFSIEED